MPAAAKSLERPYPWESSYPKAVSWDVPLKDGTLVDLIDDAVAEFGPKTALEFPDLVRGFKGQLRYSYSELGALVDQVAAGLQAQGGRQGHARGPVPAQLPLLPYFLLRGGQGRRHSGQLQPALPQRSGLYPGQGRAG